MNKINIEAFDLNLLVTFDALMRDRSVSRAADRMKLTQPAISHALGRLRAVFNDPLFIRSPTGMLPTSFAERISDQVAGILRGVNLILSPVDEFDAARSSRRFAIGMTDYTAYVVMPALAKHMERHAPNIELLIRPAHGTGVLSMIESNEIELVVGGSILDPREYISTSHMMTERFVCAMRRGHPVLKHRLTLEAYLAQSHLDIAPLGEPGIVDKLLHQQHAARRIGISIAHFLLAPAILEQTNLVATIPERMARPMAKRFGLAVLETPFDFGWHEIRQTWHRRLEHDPGLVWLRAQIATVAAEL
jgi:DNA-binding transcriptional LysR family regulator